MRNPAITTDHNVLFFWCCWKDRRSVGPWWWPRFFVNWSFVIGCLTVGIKTPLLHVITTLSWALSLFIFFRIHVLCNTGSLPREIRSDTLTQFPAVKGSFTTVKVSRVATSLICYYSHCLMQKRIMLCFLFPSIWIPYLFCKVLTKYYVIKGLCLSEE